MIIAGIAIVIFALMAAAGFVDLRKLNDTRDVVVRAKCQDCGKIKDLYYGPYDNLICMDCIIEFSKHISEQERLYREIKERENHKCEHCGKLYEDYDPSGSYCPHCDEYSQG